MSGKAGTRAWAIVAALSGFTILVIGCGPILAQVPEQPAGSAATNLDQGWTEAQRQWWYTTSQGSRLLPLSWLTSLEQKDGTDKFLSDPNVRKLPATLAFWAVAFAPGAPKYKALNSTNSWGIFHPSWDFPVGHPGRFLDNPNHPFNVIVATLARSAADISFAAGNCGTQCADGRCQGRTIQAIMGASALADVLTLAGCDTQDQRVGYSSQGPSIAGMYPQKPDVTSYTHFKGSEAFGPGSLPTAERPPLVRSPLAASRLCAREFFLKPYLRRR